MTMAANPMIRMTATPPPPFSPAARMSRLPGNAQRVVADQGQHEDAVQDANQSDIKPHVAVEDVAEFVRDHALQLIAIEVVDGAPVDADHGIGGGESGGERVDARFAIQQEHGGHGHARGQRHFLHHVQQPLLGQVVRVGVDAPPAQHVGHSLAALTQLGGLVQAARGDNSEGRHRHDAQHVRPPPGQAKLTARCMAVCPGQCRITRGTQREEDGHIQGDDHHGHGQDEVSDQQRGLPAGDVLAVKEIHDCKFCPAAPRGVVVALISTGLHRAGGVARDGSGIRTSLAAFRAVLHPRPRTGTLRQIPACP